MPDTSLLLADSVLPRFYVGGEEKCDLARDVLRLDIEEDTHGMKRLRCVFSAIGPQRNARDEQLLYQDGAVLDFGVMLEVAMGPASLPRTVFKGQVSALELAMEQSHEPEVRIYAEDKLMQLRMTRRFKTYENASPADLLRDIASAHGLQADARLDGPAMAAVQQWNQSDLAFLRAQAGRLAADVWIDGDTLHLAARAQRQGNRITLIQGNDLLAFEARADLAHQRTAIKVGGFDDAQQDAIDEEAGSGVASAQATGGRGGAAVLQQAFGERTGYRVREAPSTDGEAQAWARADLQRRARRFVTVRGTTLGSPSMTVGSLVKLERTGPAFEGDGYYVTRVHHSYDREMGMRTQFEAERGWIGNGAGSAA
jgi:uncharacterized protein